MNIKLVALTGLQPIFPECGSGVLVHLDDSATNLVFTISNLGVVICGAK